MECPWCWEGPHQSPHVTASLPLQMFRHTDSLFPILLHTLSDESDEVGLQPPLSPLHSAGWVPCGITSAGWVPRCFMPGWRHSLVCSHLCLSWPW